MALIARACFGAAKQSSFSLVNGVCDCVCAGWYRTVSSRAGVDGSGSATASERQIWYVCVLSARDRAESVLRRSMPIAALLRHFDAFLQAPYCRQQSDVHSVELGSLPRKRGPLN